MMFSVLLQELFETVSAYSQPQATKRAYLLALILGVVWLISMLGKNNGFYEVSFLAARLKSEMLFLIYSKLTMLSQFTANHQSLGKIINLISNDFNAIQSKAPGLFISFTVPFGIVGTTAVLVGRFGWAGLIIPAVILLYIPFQVLVGKINGSILR